MKPSDAMRGMGIGPPTRRALLLSGIASMGVWSLPERAMAARALEARTLVFPRDFGSHPELNTEWWYITGHATSGARAFGFQLTFFRSRIESTQAMSSAFAARQIVFAHAAVTDLDGRKLLHDKRIARAGFGVASASEADTDVRLRDWTLTRESTARANSAAGAGDANGANAARSYIARLPATGFALDLRFRSTQPVLLQGDAGLSRKGPDPAQASYYYSEPQLATRGTLTVQGRAFDVQGTAWLDHEWSDAFLHPDAVGWDWIGMNLFDGGALTAFRLRRRDGTGLWFGGSMRTADGRLTVFAPDALRFEPEATWTSPRTRAVYPTRWRIRTPAGDFTVRALLDDQELDSQGSTGAVYWEGLSELLDAAGKPIGRGYLELTGYAQPLKL